MRTVMIPDSVPGVWIVADGTSVVSQKVGGALSLFTSSRGRRCPHLFTLAWVVLVSVAGALLSLAASGGEALPERDLRFLSATPFVSAEGPRLMTLWLYEAEAKPVDEIHLPMSPQEIVYGDTFLALLEGAISEPTASEKVVWFGVVTAINIHTGRREAFDTEVVRTPGGRVFVMVMVGDSYSVEIEVYEVATGGEPRSFSRRLELHKRLWYSEEQAKPLTTYQMDIGGREEDVCLRDRLQAVAEADAVTVVAMRRDASCPARWSRLDLKALEWSDLEVEPISKPKDAEKARD